MNNSVNFSFSFYRKVYPLFIFRKLEFVGFVFVSKFNITVIIVSFSSKFHLIDTLLLTRSDISVLTDCSRTCQVQRRHCFSRRTWWGTSVPLRGGSRKFLSFLVCEHVGSLRFIYRLLGRERGSPLKFIP